MLPPDDLAERLRHYTDAGIQHIQVWLEPNSIRGSEAFAPTLEALEKGGPNLPCGAR